MRVVSGARQVLFSTTEKNAVTSIRVIGCDGGIVRLAFHKNGIDGAAKEGKFEVILSPFKPSLEGMTFEDKETGTHIDMHEFATTEYKQEEQEMHVVFDATATEILNGGGHVQFIDYYR